MRPKVVSPPVGQKAPDLVGRDLKLIDFNQTIDLGSPRSGGLNAIQFKMMKQRQLVHAFYQSPKSRTIATNQEEHFGIQADDVLGASVMARAQNPLKQGTNRDDPGGGYKNSAVDPILD